MRTATVDELYDREVRKLPLEDRLHLARQILNDPTLAGLDPAQPRTRSLLELKGLGADLWAGQDAQDYVRRLRQEWDHRA